MSYSADMASKLNELLEKNYDAEAGYKTAQEQVKNNVLKDFFNQQQKERYDFGHQLKSEIKSFGETPDKGTSVTGDIHRAWMNIKGALSTQTEESILEEAIRGEKAAIENYNEIINDASVPASTKNVLTSHRDRIQNALTKVESMEKAW